MSQHILDTGTFNNPSFDGCTSDPLYLARKIAEAIRCGGARGIKHSAPRAHKTTRGGVFAYLTDAWRDLLDRKTKRTPVASRGSIAKARSRRRKIAVFTISLLNKLGRQKDISGRAYCIFAAMDHADYTEFPFRRNWVLHTKFEAIDDLAQLTCRNLMDHDDKRWKELPLHHTVDPTAQVRETHGQFNNCAAIRKILGIRIPGLDASLPLPFEVSEDRTVVAIRNSYGLECPTADEHQVLASHYNANSGPVDMNAPIIPSFSDSVPSNGDHPGSKMGANVPLGAQAHSIQCAWPLIDDELWNGWDVGLFACTTASDIEW